MYPHLKSNWSFFFFEQISPLVVVVFPDSIIQIHSIVNATLRDNTLKFQYQLQISLRQI